MCFESFKNKSAMAAPCLCFSLQEEESEEEPKLKYERLSNGVTEILQKDAASCMTVHDKVRRYQKVLASVVCLCLES